MSIGRDIVPPITMVAPPLLGLGLGLASISFSYYVIGHFSGKNHVKFGNLLFFPAIILNRMLSIIIWYFFIIIFGLSLGLNLQKLSSASASRFWLRLTSMCIFSRLVIRVSRVVTYQQWLSVLSSCVQSPVIGYDKTVTALEE